MTLAFVAKRTSTPIWGFTLHAHTLTLNLGSHFLQWRLS